MTFINEELCRRYRLLPQYEEISNSFESDFKGIKFTDLVEKHIELGVSFETVWKLYQNLILVLSIDERSCFFYEFKISDSGRVKFSYEVANSMNINFSKYVTNSRNITRGNVIAKSQEVEDSSYVKNSNFIRNCSRVEESNYCLNSREVKFSSYVISSSLVEGSKAIESCEDVLGSAFIFKSKIVAMSLFCNNIINSQNKIFCTNMTNDSEYMIFNKRVPMDFFAIIFDKLKDFVFPYVAKKLEPRLQMIPNNKVLLPELIPINIQIDDVNFWRGIKKILPEYDADFLYNMYFCSTIYKA